MCQDISRHLVMAARAVWPELSTSPVDKRAFQLQNYTQLQNTYHAKWFEHLQTKTLLLSKEFGFNFALNCWMTFWRISAEIESSHIIVLMWLRNPRDHEL